MKIFAYILLLIIVTQVATPCCFGQDCDEKTEMAKDHKCSNHGADDASSSCTCLCCGVVFDVKNHNVQLIEPKVISTPIYIFSYSFQYHFSFQDNIWQPPRPLV